MADPIRQALERLLAVIKPKYTDPDEIVAVVRAIAAARTALAAERPAPAEPDTDAVLTLAAIIRKVDGNHSLGAAALAEAILSHPNAVSVAASVLQPPAPVPPADGEAEELAQWLDEEAKRCAAQFHDRIVRAATLLRQLPPEGLVAEEYFHPASGARIVRDLVVHSGEPGECWTVRNNRHVNPCTEFPTLAAAWAALQQARRQEGSDE